jgi:CTP:phosphocholine cytidylyltransferase-like protein
MPNFIILNAGEGQRTKSYGPKCLFKLANQECLLARQIRIMENMFGPSVFYHSIGFDFHKIIKQRFLRKTKSSHIFIENADYSFTNNFFSLRSVLEKRPEIKECFMLFGDVVFGEDISIINDNYSTVFSCSSINNKRIGITKTGLFADHLAWSLAKPWSEIAFFNNQTIKNLKTLYGSKRYNKACVSEIINKEIQAGEKIKCSSCDTVVFDIDQRPQLKIANEKFSISKT